MLLKKEGFQIIGCAIEFLNALGLVKFVSIGVHSWLIPAHGEGN
jgi:hypothetical protein